MPPKNLQPTMPKLVAKGRRKKKKSSAQKKIPISSDSEIKPSPRKISLQSAPQGFQHCGTDIASFYITDGVLYLRPMYPDSPSLDAAKRFTNHSAGDVTHIEPLKWDKNKEPSQQKFAMKVSYTNSHAFMQKKAKQSISLWVSKSANYRTRVFCAIIMSLLCSCTSSLFQIKFGAVKQRSPWIKLSGWKKSR